MPELAQVRGVRVLRTYRRRGEPNDHLVDLYLAAARACVNCREAAIVCFDHYRCRLCCWMAPPMVGCHGNTPDA